MSLKFKVAFWAIVGAQLLLLLVIVGIKEFTLRTGTEVVLQTVPVDPRSILQGDYAILVYKIGTPPPAGSMPDLGLESQPFGTDVFVTLRQSGDVWIGDQYLFSRPDTSQPFIRGRAVENGRMDFGIGTYFVPEGTGRIIERAGDVKVKVAVDRNGTAVIREVLVGGELFDPTLLPTPAPRPLERPAPAPTR